MAAEFNAGIGLSSKDNTQNPCWAFGVLSPDICAAVARVS